MSEKKMFPLWVQTKLLMMESLWDAQHMLAKYRKSKNPAHMFKFQNLCIDCWTHIRPYRDKFNLKHQESLIEALEDMLVGIPRDKRDDVEFWGKTFKFLSDGYKRLGISDVAKQEEDPNDAWKESF